MSSKTAYMGEKVIDYALGEENGVIQIHLEGFQYYFHLFPQKDYIVLKIKRPNDFLLSPESSWFDD